THNQIMFFTNYGRAFKIKCYMIPEAGRAAKGTAIVNLLQLQNGEKVTAAFPITPDDANEYLVLATKLGVIKKTPLSDFDNIRRGGIIAQNLREGDELISVMLSGGDDEFIVGTKQGMSVRFHESDVRPMGRLATGVRSIQLADGDEVADVQKIAPGADILAITERGMGKRTPESAYRSQRRGGKGIRVMNITDKTGELAALKLVTGEEDIMLIRDDGTIIRLPADQVRVTENRVTQGVRLMRVDEGTRVVSVALAPRSEEKAEDAEAAVTEAPAAETPAE
ncbi:MAG: DNA gyrase subunit A, partial [Clostridia bacterium]|nr:DNA gyrase subunit A [Clostridia bacterium]